MEKELNWLKKFKANMEDKLQFLDVERKCFIIWELSWVNDRIKTLDRWVN